MKSSVLALIVASVLLQRPHTATDVSFTHCPEDPVRIAEIEHVEILGSCDSARETLRVSVRNIAPQEHGALRAFDLEFCGQPVVAAKSPAGWRVAVQGNSRHTVE